MVEEIFIFYDISSLVSVLSSSLSRRDPPKRSFHSTDLFFVIFHLVKTLIFIFSLFYSLFTVTTLSTPVSEITTLSLQSNTNATSHSATSSSLSTDIDATTQPNERRGDESLKVLPLGTNKTTNGEDDPATVTPSPMTVNSFDTKIKPELIRKEGTIEQIVNNDGDNHQTNQPQKELVARDEKSRSNQESLKEGRAINFPMGGNENSTTPDHMSGSINFVTTSTEKTRTMDFFDLSDVSMDHDLFERKENTKMTTEKQQPTTTTSLPIKIQECSFNGTSFKVSKQDSF